MNWTLGQARNSRIPGALGMCGTDVRFAQYVNEAQQRLLTRGRYKGSIGRFQICTANALVTWPRQIESIEAAALCTSPLTLRNKWYEFLGYGPGQVDEESSISGTLVDRGWAFTTEDVADGFYLKAYADLSVDADKTILFQGIDDNGNRVLTNAGETDGEELSLSVAGVQTSAIFVKIQGVQKQVTKGPVRVYKVDPTTLVQTLIATYDPSETLPCYRRSLVPCLERANCCDRFNPCEEGSRQLTVLGRLRHIPVVNDTDYFVLSCEPALKDMAQSVQKREDNLIQEALAYEQSAIRELNLQLEMSEGGNVPIIRVINTAIGDPVENFL